MVYLSRTSMPAIFVSYSKLAPGLLDFTASSSSPTSLFSNSHSYGLRFLGSRKRLMAYSISRATSSRFLPLKTGSSAYRIPGLLRNESRFRGAEGHAQHLFRAFRVRGGDSQHDAGAEGEEAGESQGAGGGQNRGIITSGQANGR